MAKPIPLVLLFLLISSDSIFKLSYSSIIQCSEIEKEALLSFKHTLENPSDLLSSWNSSNCCNWRGVVCSNVTGNVHQLHLNGDRWYSNNSILQGQINPALLKLKHLKYLDLSQNLFYGRIPSFMESFTSLEYLNLSGNGFYGKIPPTIGNLSRLHTLDLGLYFEVTYHGRGVFYERILESDSVEWLRGLSHLEYLNMDGVNISKASSHLMQVINALPSLIELNLRDCDLNFNIDPQSDYVNTTTLSILDLSFNIFESFPLSNWMKVINTFPYLVELRLSGCDLNFNLDSPSAEVNTTSLAILDLSSNNFYSSSFPIPKWIFRLSNLVFLDLSSCGFRGSIPTISNITKLQHIDLSSNDLNSPIPDWLYSCKDLQLLSLSRNSLQSRISNDIGNLTSLNTLDLSYNQLFGEIPRGILNFCKLQMLDLSENMLQGEISDIFGNMSDCFLGSLTYLYLSDNQLFGEIPNNLEKLSRLVELRVISNRLTGNLPISMARLSNWESLCVGYNMMAGVVTETHFANLTKLRTFSANGNHFTLELSPAWNPPFKLQNLKLASWNLGIGSDIPSWLETQKKTLETLDLSNTGISGDVLSWFWEIDTLNISHNNLSGKIPDIIGSRFVYLSSNHFSGPLPRVRNYSYEIDLSSNLFSGGISHFLCDRSDQPNRLVDLHLGGNKLNGEIPDCWMKWPSLSRVNLSDNNFTGIIPNSIGTLAKMRSLNLFDNNLSGQIPISISNCTYLVKLDLSNNNLVGGIPVGIGTRLTGLSFLILRSNKLSGIIPSSICHLSSLQIIDLSNNAFSGRIPSCINNLTAMIVKRNLSHEFLGELEFTIFVDGHFLESASVATKGRQTYYDTILSLVNNIDFSNNNLSGVIPKGLTSLVELVSLNLSGNQLTGSIPMSIGDLKQLESLDLSRNVLSGEMPKSFSVMSSLSSLNLSCNNLRGRIPESTQLIGMNDSCFVGNDLCGPPLTKKCRSDEEDDEEDAENKENNDQDDKFKREWFYEILLLGYAFGLSAFYTTLVFKRPRKAYCQLLESMSDKLYVYYHISCTRSTR